MNIFEEATKDCDRDDCRLTENGGISSGISTCAGWSRTYDKTGRRTDRGDPNIRTSRLACAVCGRVWSIRRQYGETEVNLSVNSNPATPTN